MRERLEESWDLWSILAGQATLTLPWIWRTSAFTDEAQYLNIGHQGMSQLLAHASSFPGLPVIYPPVALAFEWVGGLVAARLVSLLFMLGATAMVYLIGDRMFGRICGVLAALLFAVCGIVVHLGAAATFDPMALFFLVLALYSAVRMRDAGVRWVLVCPVALAAANATKYPTLAWDPVIVGTVIFYGWTRGRRAQAIVLALSVTASTAVLDLGVLMLGGQNLAIGVLRNTVDASSHRGATSSSLGVLGHAALMTGLIILIAVAGVLASVVKRMPATATAFLCLLVLAALVAPIEQARVHQMTSLDENMAFGLPFASLAAGYALGAWRQWLGWQRHWGKVVATTAAVITVITMLIVGRVEGVQFRGPGVAVAGTIWAAIRNSYQSGTYVLLDGPYRAAQYYVPAVPGNRWLTASPTASAERLSTYALLCTGQVSVVVLRQEAGRYASPYDGYIAKLMHGSYKAMKKVGTIDHRTSVWALMTPGRRLEGCPNAA